MPRNVTIEVLRTMKNRSDIPGLLLGMNASKVVEIGVKDGGNFGNLLQPSVQLAVAIDIWAETGLRSENDDSCGQWALDSQHQHMLDWAAKDRRVRVIKDRSLNAVKQFEDGFFDMVYIDADHTESAVYADLCAWFPKVRAGGVLAGHDYLEHTLACGVKFGVINATNRFIKERGLELHADQDRPWPNWYIPVPA
jgi:hypothetical protein